MFVTMMPGRIVGTKCIEILPSESVSVGREGLSCRISCDGTSLVLSETDCADKTKGYRLCDREVLEFSGCVNICNTGTEKAQISVIETDTV